MIVACIPAFNEEEKIGKVILLTSRYVDRVIVCDDGSKDLTAEIARRLGAEVIEHQRNLGYGSALRSLFKRAREIGADIIVTLDADGQHDPRYIKRLVSPIREGIADICVGSRFLEKSDDITPLHKKVGIKLVRIFSGLEGKDITSGFRAYSISAINSLMPTEEGMGATTELLLKGKRANLRILEVPIRVEYGPESGTYHPLRLGLEILASTLKQVSLSHPLVFYGVPATLFFTLGSVFWIRTLELFMASRQFPVGTGVVALGFTLLGMMLGTTALILFTVLSVVREAK